MENNNYEMPLNNNLFDSSSILCINCGALKNENCYINKSNNIFKFEINCIKCKQNIFEKLDNNKNLKKKY